MGDEKVLCYNGREQSSSVCNVARKPQSGCKGTRRAIRVAGNHQVKGVKNVETSQRQRLANIVHWRVGSEPIIHAPLATGKLSGADHSLDCGLVPLDQIFVFRIVVRQWTIKD